jgi:UDP-2,3-diacylglucosamine pyrophosphatase LpxH
MKASSAPVFRTIWLSDTHIGTRECKIDLLLDFLLKHSSETLYLVGDIVDLRYINKSRHWLKGHERPILKLVELAEATRLVVMPGNHDRVLRLFPEFNAPNIEFTYECLHQSATGHTFLVAHGDAMDSRIRTDLPEWKIDLVCFFYYRLLRAEHRVNMLRLRLGWALKRYVGAMKARLPFWEGYVRRYESAMVAEARRRGVDGVICGHIHVPSFCRYDDILYINTGDWVENCTALIETWHGEFRLLRWDRFGLTAGAADAVLGRDDGLSHRKITQPV